MRRHLFCLFAAGLFLAGCAHLPRTLSDAPAVPQKDIPILLYHHVGVLSPSAGAARRRWTVSPEQFDAQMRWLSEQGFHPVSLAQVHRVRTEGAPLPPRPVVITFDDGWKDQYQQAFPILKKYGFPATFFIVTRQIGHSAYMTWEEVGRMSDEGMDIQAHSHTHARLSVLPKDALRRELIESKQELERRLRKPVVALAYPFGSYGEEVIASAREAGYAMGVTVNGLNGGYLFRADRTFTLPRFAVEGGDTLYTFARFTGIRRPASPALFVSLIERPPVLADRRAIDALIEYSAVHGIDTLFVQVYRENKAWFPSKTADAAPFEECLQRVGEDPFALLIRKAHEQGIRVHAWLNLLSLGRNQQAFILGKFGPEVLTRNTRDKKELKDYLIDSQYFLEPGDLRVRRELEKILRELLAAYPELDGVQFDYIRYPDTDPHYGHTRQNTERFRKAAGVRSIDEESPAWKDWRRAQVTGLLESLTAAARGARPGIIVSATGCMPYARAYHEAFQDWPSWVNRGTVDFVTLMDYSPDPKQFARWLAAIRGKVADLSRIRVGVGAYKLVRAPEAFAREVRSVRELGMTAAIFHYGSLREGPRLNATVFRENRGRMKGRVRAGTE